MKVFNAHIVTILMISVDLEPKESSTSIRMRRKIETNSSDSLGALEVGNDLLNYSFVARNLLISNLPHLLTNPPTVSQESLHLHVSITSLFLPLDLTLPSLATPNSAAGTTTKVADKDIQKQIYKKNKVSPRNSPCSSPLSLLHGLP